MLKLFEIPGICWPKLFDRSPVIDRSGIPIADYLESLGLRFVSKIREADVFIKKAELSLLSPSEIQRELLIQEQLKARPTLHLIGEPRELAPLAYQFSPPEHSLAIAPGSEFDRLFFGMPWKDPQLENWNERRDAFCWIGRPTVDRIQLALKLIQRGIPLDIYSHHAWPLPCWKGPAADDVQTARAYKYRIVSENSSQFLYHSEKLFTGIQSGCVCFYVGDPALELPWLRGTYLSLTDDTLGSRAERAPEILESVSKFVTSSAWEVYSVKSFIDRMAQKLRTPASAQNSRPEARA